MPQTTANGLYLEYESFGKDSDPCVLLIMGLGTQLTAWPESLCSQLVNAGFRVLRYDNRDVGLSSKLNHLRTPAIPALAMLKIAGLPCPVPYTLDDMARDAVGLLDALQIDQAHLVGASMGGMIAQLVAGKYPDRVLSLTSIMSTTGHRSLPKSDPQASRALLLQPDNPLSMDSILERNIRVRRAIQSPAYPKDDEELRDMSEKSLQRGGYHPQGVTRQLAAIIAAKHRRKLLQRLQLPALVIHGKDDPLVKVECGIDTARHIPDSELAVFPGMGHDLPEALVGEMASLIQETAARA